MAPRGRAAEHKQSPDIKKPIKVKQPINQYCLRKENSFSEGLNAFYWRQIFVQDSVVIVKTPSGSKLTDSQS